MRRYIYYLQKFIIALMLLAVFVGCTPRGLAPSPTIAVQTAAVIVPSTETPSLTTPIQTLTTTLAVNGTLVTTFTPSPTATVCATPSNGITYIIQPGDNLNQIALRYNMSAEELQHANCLPSADTIFAGQTIYVPFYIPPVLFQPTSAPPASGGAGIPTGLKEEISFNPGGAISQLPCPSPDPNDTLQITISGRIRDTFQMCVYGFPIGEKITIELIAPDNRHYFRERTVTETDAKSGLTVVGIDLWLPVGLPVGSWTVIARSTKAKTETAISIPALSDPSISTTPLTELNPFVVQQCTNYSDGANVRVQGVNFSPNQRLPLAVYWMFAVEALQYQLKLMTSQYVTTDSQGSFSATIIAENRAQDQADFYLAVLVTDMGTKDYYFEDSNTDCFKVP
jgi:LysM repeat protein